MGKRATFLLVVGFCAFVACSGAEPEKETVYVPVPVEQQEDPLEEASERQEVEKEICEDAGGQMNFSGDCIFPEPEEEPYVPDYVDDPCQLATHRQLNPDECAGYEPDVP